MVLTEPVEEPGNVDKKNLNIGTSDDELFTDNRNPSHLYLYQILSSPYSKSGAAARIVPDSADSPLESLLNVSRMKGFATSSIFFSYT